MKKKKYRNFLLADLMRLKNDEFEEVAASLRQMKMKTEENKLIVLDYLNEVEERRKKVKRNK